MFAWLSAAQAGLEMSFRRFKGSLYEARWHEVVAFLAAARPLLPILARPWDEATYVHGVDFAGNARPAQAQAQQRQEGAAGILSFDPKKMTSLLSSSLFHMYAEAVSLIEEVPDKLARDSEASSKC